MTEPVKLLCNCGPCCLPWATIQNGCLVVVSRHRGERHVNQIALPDLIAAMCGPGMLEKVLPLIYELGGQDSTPGGASDG